MSIRSPERAIISLRHSFFWTASGQVSQLVGAMFAGALINRALLPAGRGVLAEMQTWVALFVSLCGLSLNTAIYHFANRDRYDVSDRARLLIVVLGSLTTAVLAAAGLLTVFEAWPSKVSLEAIVHAPLLIGLLVTTIFCVNLVTLGQALGRVKLVALVTIFQTTVNVGCVIPAFFLRRIDVRFAILTAIAVQGVGCVTLLSKLGIDTRSPVSGLTPATVWQFLSAGLKQHVATVSVFAYTKANQLIVFHYCGDKQSGLFAAALTLAFGLFTGFAAFQMALYPWVIHASDEFAVTIRSLRLAVYGGVLLTLPSMLFAGPLLHLFGGVAFEEARDVFRLLILAAWTLSVSSFAAPYVIKAGAFGINGAITVAIGVLGLLLNFVLVPRLRGAGAATATVLTTLIGFGMTLGLLRVVSGKSPLHFIRPDFRQELAAFRSAVRRGFSARPS